MDITQNVPTVITTSFDASPKWLEVVNLAVARSRYSSRSEAIRKVMGAWAVDVLKDLRSEPPEEEQP